ncbi:MAG: PfkB family carbohydrate kinase [Acidobacteriota bacterium]
MNFGITLPANKPYDAIALGLNAVDHIILAPHYPAFNTKIKLLSHDLLAGGQCASAMVALARLGLKTRYIGKVGDDAEGRFQLLSLVEENVESSCVKMVEDAETQIAFIIVDQQSGERTILWNRDDKLLIDPDEVSQEVIQSGRALLLDGHNVEASIRAAEYARAAGIPTIIDIDNIYDGAERLLPLIDFLISSSSFPERLTGEKDLRTALKILHETMGSMFVAATLGAQGILAYFQNEYLHVPAFAIQAVDTTGAGDAFHAGFIYGLLQGFSVEETLRTAHAVAALKCRKIGARTGLPTLDELNEFLSSN